MRSFRPLLVLGLALPCTGLLAQASRPEPVALRLFLDCHAPGCDFDYLRTSITWVSYVRDRTGADVHVIVTSQGTGSGGTELIMAFTGERTFRGQNHELRYSVSPGASPDEMRAEFARLLRLGLAPYAVHSKLGSRLDVSFQGDTSSSQQPVRAAHDPWNFWVFSVGMGGYVNGESQNSSRGASGSFSASRTTAEWKFRAYGSGSADRNSYVLDDTTNFVARSHSYSGSVALVRSASSHLSLGGTISSSGSTRQNIDVSARAAPTVEYDFLRYDQYSRRRLVASYTIGVDHYQYIDTTVYNRIAETRLDQQLSLSYATTQPWGNANVGISGSSYLSDAAQNRTSLYAGISIRVARGLQLGYSVSYSRVRDQLSLVKSGASDAEILLRLRQLATSYTYGSGLSLSYTFGSLFNNVVNPRMGF